jgi:hypothetical protein
VVYQGYLIMNFTSSLSPHSSLTQISFAFFREPDRTWKGCRVAILSPRCNFLLTNLWRGCQNLPKMFRDVSM